MQRQRPGPWIVAGLVAIALAGCAGTPAPTAVPVASPAAVSTPAVAATDTAPPPATETVEPTREPTATARPEPTTPPSPIAEPSPPNPTPEPAAELSLAETVAAAFPAPPTAAGEVILVTGQVLDRAGNPLPGLAVEFWQTDSNGIYDHPDDPGTARRDPGFQFYGTAITGDDGRYLFRTVRPGYYEPRPKHIHLKVKRDGRELLTSQFYFEEDRADLGNEGVFSTAGGLGELLILKVGDTVTVNGVPMTLLTNDLVIDAGGGSLTATPQQTEGPYYPVAAVADFDNDLAAAP